MSSTTQPVNTCSPESSLKTASQPETKYLDAAFELAYFIYPDKATALRVAMDALDQLEVATSAQDRRLYYNPTGHRASNQSKPQRTRVLMNEMQLLQRLVYTTSESYERQQEQAGNQGLLGEEDMIIRFIKHLVRITVRRNSFYVTLGLSRLLHNYTTSETMNLYSIIVQDPRRVKDDTYYRSRKGHLMQEVQERFGKLITRIRGPRGEDRFEAEDDSRQRAALVRECLKVFTPWSTACVVPDHFDPKRNDLSSLAFVGSDPDREHPVEVNRMHTILHPDCYRRLAGGLRLDEPERRLSLPRFAIAKREDDGSRPRSDRRPPELSEQEKSAVLKELYERAARRKRMAPVFLSIVVDGEERALLDLSRESCVGFNVEESAELIEVRARDEEGEVRMAVHLLSYSESEREDEPAEYSVVLEGGQRITFLVSANSGSDGEIDGARIEVAYGETNAVRAAGLHWRRMKHRGNLFSKTAEPKKGPGHGELCRQFAFGRMNVDEHLEGTDFSILKRLCESQRALNHDGFYQRIILGLIKGVYTNQVLGELGEGLVALAHHAYTIRQMDVVEQISQTLMNLPLHQEYQNIALYYQGLCIKRRGHFDEARVIFERVADQAPLRYRVKAILSLGAVAAGSSDFRSALSLSIEAGRIAAHYKCNDLLSIIDSQWMIAVLKSIDGDHYSALALLEKTLPCARAIMSQYPSLWCGYQNSLAVELNEVGRLEEAQNACKIALASPYAHAYPEWHDTREEIALKTRRASRSIIALSSKS